MEKQFTRSRVREISEKLQERLNEIGKELGIALTLNGGNFSPDKFKLNLEGRIIGESGSVVISDHTHALADAVALCKGLKLQGHLIGSLWKIRDKVYTVTDYKTKRPKYPISLMSEGHASKAGIGFLKQGVQLVVPTEDEFYLWLTIDPDEDSVKESDVEVIDRVQEYFENAYAEDMVDPFLEKAALFTEKGITKVGASKIYDQLIRLGIDKATEFMNEMLEMPKYKKK